MAQETQDRALLLEAHYALGNTLCSRGEFRGARAHSEQGVALYDAQKHSAHAFLYGHDTGMVCLSFAAWALWYLGYPDQALERTREALRLAEDLKHPQTLAAALAFAAWLHHFRREGQAVQERAEAALALATEQEFPTWIAVGTIFRRFALALQGPGEIAPLSQAIDAWRAMGTELARPYFLSLLAEACEKAGQFEEGLCVVAEALAVADETGDRQHQAELYRLKGELTLQRYKIESLKVQDPRSEAEACFHRAIDIAHLAGGKVAGAAGGDELEPAMAATGPEERSAKAAGGDSRLVHGGFGTADLREAKVLLTELA